MLSPLTPVIFQRTFTWTELKSTKNNKIATFALHPNDNTPQLLLPRERRLSNFGSVLQLIFAERTIRRARAQRKKDQSTHINANRNTQLQTTLRTHHMNIVVWTHGKLVFIVLLVFCLFITFSFPAGVEFFFDRFTRSQYSLSFYSEKSLERLSRGSRSHCGCHALKG